MVLELRVAVALARMTSTTMQIETFALMLVSEAQTFPVIVPEIVTSAETGGLIHSTGLVFVIAIPAVAPATVATLSEATTLDP
jgi:hypothetical protein